jgi:hypothetical protein
MRPDYTLAAHAFAAHPTSAPKSRPVPLIPRRYTRTDADDACLDYLYTEHSGSFGRDRFAGVTLEVGQHFRVHAFDFS